MFNNIINIQLRSVSVKYLLREKASVYGIIDLKKCFSDFSLYIKRTGNLIKNKFVYLHNTFTVHVINIWFTLIAFPYTLSFILFS